jgi:hypothetical protein
MQELFEGIYDKYDGSALESEITGMYLEEAIQGAVYPYCVYHKISGVPNYTYTEEAENIIIQFDLYDDNSSATDINTAFSALTTLYDWCSLTVAGWNSIYMKRELDLLNRENDIWHYIVSYRLEIQK